MAEVTFNRELGANPTPHITRFGQFRQQDASNVTITDYSEYAAEGSFPLADVYKITYGASGPCLFTLFAGAVGVTGFRVINSSGVEVVNVQNPKITRRENVGATLTVSSGDTASLYVDRSSRSPATYRLTMVA
jgi:hypothetical protein